MAEHVVPGVRGALEVPRENCLRREEPHVREEPRADMGASKRFMVIVNACKSSEAGVLPDEKLLAEMGKFNSDARNHGVGMRQPDLPRSRAPLASRLDEPAAAGPCPRCRGRVHNPADIAGSAPLALGEQFLRPKLECELGILYCCTSLPRL